MELWKIISIFGILAVFTIGMAHAYTNSSTIAAQVVVPGTCIVSLNTSSISFGSVNSGTDTGATNQIVNITNSGSTTATNTTIKGGTWSDGGSNTMPVGQTEYSTSTFTYGAGTTLTASDAAITGGNLANGASLNAYFGVGVPVSQAAATYNQTITVTMNC